MKPAKFAYARPDDVRELVDLLASEHERARVLAGGMSLGAMLNMRLVTPELIVDINRIRGLDTIDVEPTAIRIGAMVRQELALRDPILAKEAPLVVEALRHVGHFQTRSRGTIGGSIAHADPSAELPLALTVLDGEVELKSRRGLRNILAKDFFISALKTARRADEFVASIRVKRQQPNDWFAFQEFAIRAGDYAIVACACQVTVDEQTILDIHLGFSGIGDTPVLVGLSNLRGQHASDEIGNAAVRVVAETVKPIGDLHASSEYRHQLCRVLAKAAICQALAAAERNQNVSRRSI